jgi:hypothetical protein
VGSYEDALTRLGFIGDPFLYPKGEDLPPEFFEEKLVSFPDSEKVLDLQQSAVLLASPGSGKTTWRRHVERKIAKETNNKSLIVVYDHFDFDLSINSTINLDTHKKSLLSRIALAVFNHLDTRKIAVTESYLRNWWYAFLIYYLPSLHQSRVAELLQIDSNAATHVNQWQNTSGLQSVLLDELLPALSSVEINRLYILMDGLDGFLETQNQEIMAALIKPLVSTHSLLSNDVLIWKLFLPDALLETIKQSSGYKTRRLEILSIEWDIESLRQLLELRLSYASQERINDFTQLFEDNIQRTTELTKIFCELTLMSKELGAPRKLLRLGRQLFEQTSGGVITLHEWNTFIQKCNPPLPSPSDKQDTKDRVMEAEKLIEQPNEEQPKPESVDQGAANQEKGEELAANLMHQLIQKISDQPLLFVIAIALILTTFALQSVQAGNAEFRLVVSLVALLAVFGMVGYYLMQLRFDPPPEQKPFKSAPTAHPPSKSNNSSKKPASKLSQLSPSLLTAKQDIDVWVKALEDSPTMQNRDSRLAVQAELPPHIRNSLNSNLPTLNAQLRDLVRTCQNHPPDGLTFLVQAIHKLEGDSRAVQHLRSLL